MKTVVPILLVAAALAPQTPAQKRPVTHEDIFLMKRTGAAVPSPDGKWIVYTLTEPDYDASKTVVDLWVVAADGSHPARRLTSSKGPESGVAWSPDSTRIAFSAKREGDEAGQIYVLPMAGGEAQRLTTLATGAVNPAWRPDGKALLFESSLKPERKTPAKSTARVYDSMPVRYWNAWLDGAQPHIFTLDLATGAATDLLAGTKLLGSPGFTGLASGLSSERSLHPIWSPDGREIVFVASENAAEMMKAETETHLYRLSATGGEPVRFTAPGQSFVNPQFSPDGKTLYALHQNNPTPQRIYSLSRLARMDWPTASTHRLLSAAWDRSVSNYVPDHKGETVVMEAEDNGFVKLFAVSVGGGTPKAVAEPAQGGYSSPTFAGTKLIATYGASTQPNEIALVENGRHRLLTLSNAGALAKLDMPAPEHFWFTAKNGKRIHSLVVLPPSLDRTKKYPLLVFPHGGPNAMSADAFSTRWNYHLLTAPGYVLLMTNYTGSTGFGEQFTDDIERDVLRGPAREILEAVDAAIAKYPFIDRERQAAAGASYGGYLMNWFNGTTRQFKCIVNHAGAVNNESQYGANDGGLTRELRMGSPVWQTGKGQWMDQSPMRYAAEWKTPSLITQGELDYRVPVNESMTTFKLLHRLGVPARLVVFPDEGHWILKGENNRHHMAEVMGWLRKYL